MKVLMIGATGHYAGLVLPELTKRGVTVRALVRGEDEAAEARQRGAAETALGDLGDPASLRAAVTGADGVFHINPAFAPHEAELGQNMVAAVQAAGVRKFVFSSVIHPSLSLASHAAKRPVEETVYDSGLDFTVLQPTMYMQNFAGSWPKVAETGKLSMMYSRQAKVYYVDFRDVAKTAALAMTTDRLAYGTFELCAPGLIDGVDTAALMSVALGRPVKVTEIPVAEGAKTLSPAQRKGLTALNAAYDKYGFAGGNALVLRAILGRAPRTLQQYFQELAGHSAPT